MNIRQIDYEIERLQQQRQERAINVVFDVDKSIVSATSKITED